MHYSQAILIPFTDQLGGFTILSCLPNEPNAHHEHASKLPPRRQRTILNLALML